MTTTTVKMGSYFTGKILGHKVYAKLNWTDAWVLKEHVHCANATWAALPSNSTAQLYYRYGPVIVPGQAQPIVLDRFTLPTLAYVRIDFDVVVLPDSQTVPKTPTTTTRSWYGIIGTLVDSFFGSDFTLEQSGGSGSQTVHAIQGVQTLNGVGLEWLLDRTYINRSWYKAHDGTRKEVAFGMDFNAATSKGLVGNRSSTHFDAPNNSITRIFADEQDLPDAYKSPKNGWCTKDIVEYLLGWHAGRNQVDLTRQTWKLVDTEGLLPTWDRPFIQGHNTRILQIINQLICRQRGLACRLAVANDSLTDSSAAVIELRPFTTASKDVDLGIDDFGLPIKIPANSTQVSVDLTQDMTCGAVTVTDDGFAKFDQVRVVGERAQVVGSLDWSALETAWESTDEDDYKTAASTSGDYPASTDDVAARQRMNAEYRSQPRLRDVYRLFQIKSAWTRKNTSSLSFFSVVTPQKSTDIPHCELRILPRLPMFAGQDYTSSTTFSPAIDATPAEQLPPLVFLKRGAFDYVEGRTVKVSQHIESTDSDVRNYLFSVTLSPTDWPGQFELEVSGQPQHILAATDFVPLAGVDQDIVWGDFRNMIFTVAMPCNFHCEGIYPDDLATMPDYDPNRTLRVRIIESSDFKLHAILKGTAIGVNTDNTLKTVTGDKYLLRDDRERAKQHAKRAFAWYGSTRRSMQFQTQFMTSALEVGTMIANLIVKRDGTKWDGGREDVNTVITTITINNSIGETVSPPTISYQTEFSELDLVGSLA